jgi:prefoldin beta subunit
MGDKEKNYEELQMIEQAAQNLLLQKQLFQVELNETHSALESLKDVKGDVFKIVGNLMFKAEKETLKKELEHKSKLLELRLQAIEKQEDDLSKKGLKIKGELIKERDKK